VLDLGGHRNEDPTTTSLGPPLSSSSRTTQQETSTMDDASQDMGLDVFSDSDISDDSVKNSDDEDELEEERRRRKRRRKIRRGASHNAPRAVPAKKRRRVNRQRSRRHAETLLQEGIDDGLFRSEYRMSPESFRKLVELLRGDLEPKDIKKQKKPRKNCLDPETKVMMTLRWLAGGQYVDQCRRNGVSKAAVFTAFQQVIHAITSNPNIGAPKWPTTVEECDEIANGWAKLSGPSESRGLFTTVIGMLDGILISTRSPTKRETKRPDDYRSGHKKKIGLNCQAICDSTLRFLFVSVQSPGKTNDLKAYRMSKLCDLIEGLPEGYMCGGDNAYVNSEHLLVPFPGQQLPQRKDAFNFFLSQLRIRIENAFALLVRRWGILWRPLNVCLNHQPRLIMCLCKLHNYCIDEKEKCPPVSGPAGIPTSTANVYTEDEFNSEVIMNRSEWMTEYQFTREVAGGSLRNTLADRIHEKNFCRPGLNLERNALGLN
jgi:hypothetical protein